MSKIIAVQAYVRMERTVAADGQKTVIHHHMLSLYEERIVTHDREFPIREVYDTSYRRLGGGAGMLYLHTRTGVYPYHVHSDPGSFMAAFKERIRTMQRRGE